MSEGQDMPDLTNVFPMYPSPCLTTTTPTIHNFSGIPEASKDSKKPLPSKLSSYKQD